MAKMLSPRKPTPMMWFVILLVIACGLALGLPPDPHELARLHISAIGYRVAITTLLIPYALIWYTGFYVLAKLQEYCRYVKKTKEGVAFRKITAGIGVLAFGLVIPTIISLILDDIAQHTISFAVPDTIINTYITLLVPVLSLTLINGGSYFLMATTKARASLASMRVFAVLFILLSVVFTFLVMRNHAMRHSLHLNTVLLILTFIVPYLYAWYAALMSAFELRLYSQFVKGLLYRRALVQFSSGIAIAIFGSIAIQFVQATIAERVSKSLGSLLVIEYVLLLIVAAGLLVMAAGTRKLKKIEEV
jgi:hypothetical protein